MAELVEIFVIFSQMLSVLSWRNDRCHALINSLVENLFLKLKVHRRFSTRYEKRADSFFAVSLLAAILVWIAWVWKHPLERLDFQCNVKGDHFIYTKAGIEVIINIQPVGNMAKLYQIKQVHSVILRYQLESGAHKIWDYPVMEQRRWHLYRRGDGVIRLYGR